MAALLFFLPFNNHENEQEWEGRVFSRGGGRRGTLMPNKRLSFFFREMLLCAGSLPIDIIARGEDSWGP